MSTVTLSHPHCAIISAENPEGIASHPLTAALPAFHRSFSLLSAMPSPFGRAISPRHREGTLAKRWQARQMRAKPATSEGASPEHRLFSNGRAAAVPESSNPLLDRDRRATVMGRDRASGPELRCGFGLRWACFAREK